MVATTFFLYENRATRTPLENAMVRVFSEDGSTFVTEGPTGPDGEVTFDLDDLTTYWVRFALVGYRFPVRAFASVDATQSNTFDIEGIDLVGTPTSPYVGMCRISGVVVDPAGTPAPGVSLRFLSTPDGTPRIFQGRPVVPYQVHVRSQDDGYVEFDLIQGGLYEVAFEGIASSTLGGFTKEVRVPPCAAVTLADLIWPYVTDVSFSPTALSLAVGEEGYITPTVTSSNGLELPVTYADGVALDESCFVRLTNDGGGAEMRWDAENRRYVLSASSPGTTVFTAELVDGMFSEERVPAVTTTLGSFTVVVT